MPDTVQLSDQAIQNLMVLSAHALGGKPFQAEPEHMAELWAHVAQAKAYLISRKDATPAKANANEPG
jgi:hypothetical protein